MNNNNNNTNNTNNNNNYGTFKKIWNNIYLQTKIKNYLKLYNCFRYSQYIHLNQNTLEVIKNNEILEYIKSIVIYDIKKQSYQYLLEVLRYLKPFQQIESITIFQEDLLNNEIKELLEEFCNIDTIIFQETTVPLHNDVITPKVTNIIFEFLDTNQGLSYSPTTSIFPTNGLTKLTLGLGFNSIIEPNTLPQTLKCLTFNIDYNQPILPNTLPQSLESIVFGTNFNQPIDYLPHNLLKLSLGNDFNQPFQGLLPKTLKKFSIMGNFSEPANEDGENNLLFPNSIESLEMYSYLGDNYIFKLPKSLNNLIISNNYFKNNSIDFNNRNPNLSKISIISNNSSMFNLAPLPQHQSLQNRLNHYQFNFFKTTSFNNLKKLELNSTLSSLFQENKNKIESLDHDIICESNLEKLKVLFIKEGNLDFINSRIKFSSINTLKINLFGPDTQIEQALFPPTLKSIKIHSNYGHFSLNDDILLNLENLTSITLNCYRKPIQKEIFPKSLLNLELIEYRKQLDESSLPETLVSLKLISRYPLSSDIFPSGLKVLYTNQLPKIQPDSQWLPSQLEYLLINEKYKPKNLSNINHSNIPESLKTIYLSNLNHDFLYDNKIYYFLKENLNMIVISNQLNSVYKKIINK
ncbi:hypothetical protein DICPUDRAFT_100035 [Dictyostelium purpureum]|uniref:FNIP repeat-containing protein n=1 Tax=Dictyostelium purpureum TaxID=5786 RepID=F1A4W1_DICPU|nr:uncharacterized protein DICPUDRAFT_100035 [Dictyostelium purpureum]EGC28770.1 hypothetical protein DICPUDRAFT_100035 [Dictyostelium purpureum]|eukprot:XP_003294705.1 hypothetical protein DICPUDRAFT_100035 [Dictyostelium purpureum]